MTTTIGLDGVKEAAEKIVQGQIRGRLLVEIA
jgi:hypothetical protein